MVGSSFHTNIDKFHFIHWFFYWFDIPAYESKSYEKNNLKLPTIDIEFVNSENSFLDAPKLKCFLLSLDKNRALELSFVLIL